MESVARQLDTTNQDVDCRYCRQRMLRVVLGWHCPACHASAGEMEHASH